MSDSEEGYETSDYTSDEEPVPAKPVAKPVVATKPATAPTKTTTVPTGGTATKTTTTTTTTTTKTVAAAKPIQKVEAKPKASEDSDNESEEEGATKTKSEVKQSAPKAAETKKAEPKKEEIKKVEPKKEEPKKSNKKEDETEVPPPKEEPKDSKKKGRAGSEAPVIKPLSIPLKDREEYFKNIELIENEHAIRYQIQMTFINDRTKIVNTSIDLTVKRTKLFIEFLNKKLDYCRKAMEISKSTQKLFEPFASPTLNDKEARELKEKVKNDDPENPQQLPDDWKDPTFISLYDYFEDCEFEIENQYYEAYKRYEPLVNDTMKKLLSEYKEKTSELVNDAKKVISKFEAFNKSATNAYETVRSTYRHILSVGVDGKLSGKDLYRDVVRYTTTLNQADQSLTYIKDYFSTYIDKFTEIDTEHYKSYLEHIKTYFGTEFLVLNGIYGPVAPYEEFFKAFKLDTQIEKTKTDYTTVSDKYLPDELNKIKGQIVDSTPDIINNPYLKLTAKVKYNTKNGWVDNYAILTIDNHIILYNIAIDDPTNPESVIAGLNDIRGEPTQYFRMNLTTVTEGSKGSDGAVMEFEEQVKKFGLFKSTVKNLLKFSSVEVRTQWIKQINEYKDKASEEVD